MHAYLVTGPDETAKNQKVNEIVKSQKATLMYFEIKKIEHVRALGKFLNLVPVSKTAILLSDIDMASTEAINAFLKNLEEKDDFLFILTAQNSSSVLPTIVSRCVVIQTSPSFTMGTEAKNFFDEDTPGRLNITYNFKTRENAKEFIDGILIYCSKELKKTSEIQKVSKIIEQALITKKHLKANTNVALQLTSFVLSLEA